MKQVELTSKLVLAIVGLAAVSAIIIPTYAVPTIRSADIFDETIQSVDIKNGEVKTEDLASGAVKPNVQMRAVEEVIEPNHSQIALVDCPAGMIATGGGFSTAKDVHVTVSMPADANTWEVDGHNDDTVESFALRAHVLCIGPSP